MHVAFSMKPEIQGRSSETGSRGNVDCERSEKSHQVCRLGGQVLIGSTGEGGRLEEERSLVLEMLSLRCPWKRGTPAEMELHKHTQDRLCYCWPHVGFLSG